MIGQSLALPRCVLLRLHFTHALPRSPAEGVGGVEGGDITNKAKLLLITISVAFGGLRS